MNVSLADKTPVAPLRSVRSAPIVAAARTALAIAAQIAVLWSIDLGASAAAATFHAPIPGNVLGLSILFALLSSGIVKLSWLEPTATLFVKHFAFFFIPITVSLMGMGRLLALHGIGIILILAVSGAIGMATCGLTSARLMNARNDYTTYRKPEPKA